MTTSFAPGPSNYGKDMNTQTIRIRKPQSLLMLIIIHILVTTTILSFKDPDGFETNAVVGTNVRITDDVEL